MAVGYNGKILRVNLTEGTLKTEELPDSFYRQYFGGEGFIAYFLMKEVPPKTDPLSPQNKLIFAAGILTGVPVGGCGRHSVGAKSPLTGGFGESDCGGYWGAELKMSGFDAIIVEGKSPKPVYININDGKAEIKSAAHLWGMRTLECEDAIRKELGDVNVKVAQIGPAGEKLVLFANISNDLDAAAGRTGMGAVMGSKNLKAIACRGHQRQQFADPATVTEIGKWVRDNAPVNNAGQHNFGTAAVLMPLNATGGLPTRNFQYGSFKDAENLSGETLTKTLMTKRRSCYACPVQCKREVAVTEPYIVNPKYGGPEYETIGAFGSNCGIGDLKAVSYANELANGYGIDTISCGMAISFAMECYEKGVLTKDDTGGMDLSFGNVDSMLKMIELISERKGFGQVFSGGTTRASKSIKGSEAFVIAVKGQEFPMHEPRLKQGMGVGYAISPTGADHCHNMHDTNFVTNSPTLKELNPLGILNPMANDDLSLEKVRLLVGYTNWLHFLNSGVCCYFVVMYGGVGLERLSNLTRAVTGWNTSIFELMRIGERAVNLARLFNNREGFTAADDTLPQRFFAPQPAGPLKVGIDRQAFMNAKEAYYRMMGWDSGVPTRGKLEELGIEWAGK